MNRIQEAAYLSDGGNAPESYEASLCHLSMTSELLPYQHTRIAAANDTEAVHKSEQWARLTDKPAGSERWLVVKHGSRWWYLKKLAIVGAAL